MKIKLLEIYGQIAATIDYIIHKIWYKNNGVTITKLKYQWVFAF